MSKPLSSFKDEKEKKVVIARRIREKSGGLGYVSALEAAKHYKILDTKGETE